MNDLLLEMCKLEKWYQKHQVLDIDTFSLIRGDNVALLGENGSGKSTLLRVIAGISNLTKGEFVKHEPMRSMRLAYVPQSGGIYPNLTVDENLQLFARLYNVNTYHTSGKQDYFIKDVGLDRYLDYPVENLSGGFQRLTSIACALSIKPQGLFLDEPLTGLDIENRKKAIDTIISAQKSLDFMIMTAHSMDEVGFCNKSYTLSNGQFQ